MKSIFTIILIVGLSLTGFSQNTFRITGGNVKVSGTTSIVLSNTQFVNNASFTPDSGQVVVTGIGSDIQSAIGGTSTTAFYNLILNKISNGAQLGNSIQVSNQLNMAKGNFDLNGSNITLGSASGIIFNESDTSYIHGSAGGKVIKTLTLNAPSSVDPGNMGAVISSMANLGTTTIERGHEVQTVAGGIGEESIGRYYDISPANNSGLSATLRLNYFDHELNTLTESELGLWQESGGIWTNREYTTRDATNNFAELTGIDAFSRWTLGSQTCYNDTIYTTSCLAASTSYDSLSTVEGCDSITITIDLGDTISPTAVCQDITMYLDSTGNASITAADVDGGSTDNCGIDSIWLGQTSFDCNDTSCYTSVEFMPLGGGGTYATNPGQWQSFTATHSGNLCAVEIDIRSLAGNTAIMKIFSGEGIGGALLDSQQLYDDGLGLAFFQNVALTAGLKYTIFVQTSHGVGWRIVGSDLYTGGMNSAEVNTDFKFRVKIRESLPVTLFAADGTNIDSCIAQVSVLDTIKPIALCVPNYNITLTQDTVFRLIPDINNGSHDNCGFVYTRYSPNYVMCADQGPIEITLFVGDGFGNNSTCTTTVDVTTISCDDNDCATIDTLNYLSCECVHIPDPLFVDSISPVAVCQDITVYLDATGNASIASSDVDNGSSDACGIDSLSVTESEFSCLDIGYHSVTLSVFDVSENSD
ncbi:MAG: hypothetical protein GY751_11730, partial [Bacteroidetes bacterium]|nr:hypothetical protein [Bacteroidota bacterium]